MAMRTHEAAATPGVSALPSFSNRWVDFQHGEMAPKWSFWLILPCKWENSASFFSVKLQDEQSKWFTGSSRFEAENGHLSRSWREKTRKTDSPRWNWTVSSKARNGPEKFVCLSRSFPFVDDNIHQNILHIFFASNVCFPMIKRTLYIEPIDISQLMSFDFSCTTPEISTFSPGLRAQVTQIWRLLDANGVKVPSKDDSELRNRLRESPEFRPWLALCFGPFGPSQTEASLRLWEG